MPTFVSIEPGRHTTEDLNYLVKILNQLYQLEIIYHPNKKTDSYINLLQNLIVDLTRNFSEMPIITDSNKQAECLYKSNSPSPFNCDLACLRYLDEVDNRENNWIKAITQRYSVISSRPNVLVNLKFRNRLPRNDMTLEQASLSNEQVCTYDRNLNIKKKDKLDLMATCNYLEQYWSSRSSESVEGTSTQTSQGY